MNGHLPDFTDKYVVFYVSYNTPAWFSEGITLESPVWREYGNRIFVTGQTPESVSPDECNWSDNHEAALAWDSVIHYIVLPSEEYQSARIQDSAEKVEVTNDKQEISRDKNSSKRLLAITSLTLIGLIIPIALLIAIILWIVKML